MILIDPVGYLYMECASCSIAFSQRKRLSKRVRHVVMTHPFSSVFCYFLVSVAASENAEQIKEEVDEIEIQGECTE